MVCKNCNNKLDSDSRYCKHCGQDLSNTSDEIIRIRIINMKRLTLHSLELRSNSTYKELLDLMIEKGIVPSNILSLETIEIFDNIGKLTLRSNQIESLKFDDTVLSNYFEDDACISLYYEGKSNLCSMDVRNCLYGCPMSKNVDIEINIKEGFL